ncbi:MAG: helix-turn-helix domain-containing protein [Candidatus Cyclobacteriaceae bacterium M3_2C_046]
MDKVVENSSNQYRLITSNQPVKSNWPVIFCWELNTQGLPNDIYQNVFPANYFDFIFPLEEGLQVQGVDHVVIKPFVSPILKSGKQLCFRKNGRIFGVRVNPAYARLLFNIPLEELQSNPNEMELVMPARIYHKFIDTIHQHPKFQQRSIKINEIILKEIHPENEINEQVINYSLQLIKDIPDCKVSYLCTKTGYSERWIEKLFKKNLGKLPSQVIKIARFNRFLELLHTSKGTTLTRLSYEAGYHDQSHLIRDFKNISGLSIKKYIRDKPQLSAVMNHL